MRVVGPSGTLEIWEQASGLHRLDQALVMLQYGFPEMAWQDLVELSIGRRDALLLKMRESIFGSKLEGFVACPACREGLEFVLSTRDLIAPEARVDPNFRHDGKRALLRPANSRDLAGVLDHPADGEQAQELALSCVVELSEELDEGSRGDPVDDRDDVRRWLKSLPSQAFDDLSERLSDLDPQASLELNLSCKACEHRWISQFDIGAYLWDELGHAARAIAAEVHTLARCYGWAEHDILRMSSRRRATYLGMAQALVNG